MCSFSVDDVQELRQEIRQEGLEFVLERTRDLLDETDDLHEMRRLFPVGSNETKDIGQVVANVLLGDGDQDGELLEHEGAHVGAAVVHDGEERRHDLRQEGHTLGLQAGKDVGDDGRDDGLVVRGERRVAQNVHQGRDGDRRVVLLARRREAGAGVLLGDLERHLVGIGSRVGALVLEVAALQLVHLVRVRIDGTNDTNDLEQLPTNGAVGLGLDVAQQRIE